MFALVATMITKKQSAAVIAALMAFSFRMNFKQNDRLARSSS